MYLHSLYISQGHLGMQRKCSLSRLEFYIKINILKVHHVILRMGFREDSIVNGIMRPLESGLWSEF